MNILKAIGFTALAAAAHALPAGDEDSLRQRSLLESYAYRTTTEFCLITRNGGDSAAAARLNQVLTDGQKLSNQLAGQWPEVAKQWAETSRFIAEHTDAAEGGDVVNVLPNLKLRQTELYAAFDVARPAGHFNNPDEEQLLIMLDSLERMLASYTMFHTSMFGGHAVTEMGIDEQSVRFEQAMMQLKNVAVRDEILRKWHFVKDTLLAYNERAAVFIVDRTGRTIRELITGELAVTWVASE